MSAQNTDRIDVSDKQALNTWAKKFNATADQIQDAVEQVGDHPNDVEMHLKGSRASTNSERVADQI